MTWARLDDLYDDHRKVKRAWRAHPRAVGLHVMAIAYCSRHGTDGVVDLAWITEKIPGRADRGKVLAALVECGLFDAPDDAGSYRVHDFLDWNPTVAQVRREREWDRRRKELFRDPELVAAIRERDHDRCRYCGTRVNWKDRRGPNGATYDYLRPDGPNTLANVVVACRHCATRKGGKTPVDAGMPLLQPGPNLTHGPTSELAPDLAPNQNGPSSEARSVQVLHPIPSHPIPVKSPPSPPEGGRHRDLVAFADAVAAWGAEHFPNAREWAVRGVLQDARSRGVDPADAEELERYARQLGAVWVDALGLSAPDDDERERTAHNGDGDA